MNTRALMTHRATIERNTSVSDSAGGYTEAWTVAAADVPCYAWYVSARTIVASARPGVEKTRFVLVPKGTDVNVGDRLQAVTDREGVSIMDGPLIVDAVGERTDHLSLMTRHIE